MPKKTLYEVEKVVGHRLENKKSYYCVKWKGYTETTWEPPSSLRLCPELLEAFNSKRKKEKKKTNITPRKSKKQTSKKKTLKTKTPKTKTPPKEMIRKQQVKQKLSQLAKFLTPTPSIALKSSGNDNAMKAKIPISAKKIFQPGSVLWVGTSMMKKRKREIALAKRGTQLPGLFASITKKRKQTQSKSESELGPRRKKQKESYGIYTYRVLKQVHPGTGISKGAIGIMNCFLNDVFERLASEAGRLCRDNKKAVLTSREIQTAVRLLLPGELAKHAVSQGTKATATYTSSSS